jgi:Ca2+-transporting ATPase
VTEGEKPARGLSRAEAARLLAEVGPNALPPAERPTFLRRLVRQLKSALIYLLLFALALDASVWLYEGAHGTPIEALAILAVLALNAGLGVLEEYRSENALAELERLGTPRVWVYRDGGIEQIDAATLVPGDVVRIEAGDRIQADGRAERTESVTVDESLLTGESLPVVKEDGSELSSGTLVMTGRAELHVTRTGPKSTMGRLASSLARIETGKTPLEARLDDLGRELARYVGVLSVALLGIGVAVEGIGHFAQIAMFAVAFAVAVVPESMPAMMTLSLAFGVERMARKNAVIRRLAAVEALGSVTVIATDKTGTLTLNRLAVERLDSQREEEAVLALTLANDAEHLGAAGDPLDRGLIDFAVARGADVAALRNANPRVMSRPFDSRRRCMVVTVEAPGGTLRCYMKGAAEVVLEHSTLDAEARQSWLALAEAHSREGMKVLGLAQGQPDAQDQLDFLGLVTLWDAPRPGAREAVEAALGAGIRVVMVTGDHPETARAIGERVGIVSEQVLTGEDVDRLTDPELDQALGAVRIFSRLYPEHKLRIIERLQLRGEVVAMTGDGLNDAPALKKADIGVAMGQRGSEVAREVADVVLLDDQFSTIVLAIEEGRIIYANILNFLRFTSSSNVALMLLVLGGAFGSMFLGLRNGSGALLLPLTALAVLWINFLGDGPPALALAADRSPEVMREPPRRRDSKLLGGTTARFILLDGSFKGAAGLALLFFLPKLGVSIAGTAAAVFVYESVAKLTSAYPARRVGSRASRNPWLHLAVGAGVALSAVCVLVPPLRATLGLAPFEPQAALPLGLALALTALGGEIFARVLRHRSHANVAPGESTDATDARATS